MLEGHSFIVGAAVSIGGRDIKPGINVHRFANRIPLLFEVQELLLVCQQSGLFFAMSAKTRQRPLSSVVGFFACWEYKSIPACTARSVLQKQQQSDYCIAFAPPPSPFRCWQAKWYCQRFVTCCPVCPRLCLIVSIKNALSEVCALMLQGGSDVITKTALKRISWSAYKINQATDKIGVFVSIVSTKIPYKGAGKEYIGMPPAHVIMSCIMVAKISCLYK